MHEVLTGRLDRRAKVIARTEQTMRELVDVIIGGGELDDVCRMLAQWTGVAAAVTTLDGRVRSICSNAGDYSNDDVLGLSCFDSSGRFRVEDEPSGRSRPGPVSGPTWANVVIEGGRWSDSEAVSYTHLTLPTILRV